MKQLQRIDEGDGVTVRYLPDNQVALTGQLVALERKVHSLRAVDRLVGQPSEFVETGRGRRVTVTVQLRPAPVGLLLPWYQRPGLVVSWAGAGCGLVLSVGAAVSWVVGAIAALWPLLVGVAAVLVGGSVLLSKLGGRGKPSGTWTTD